MEHLDLLESEQYYHIYNQGNAGVNLFRNEGNYHFFLQRFEFYITPVAHIHAFVLMPNHFHFLVQIKSDCDEVKASRAFGNLFNSYAQAFNKQQKRTGSLFRKRFRRKKITTQQYLNTTIVYIHNNPVKHGYTSSTIEYSWSSYHDYVSSDKSFVETTAPLEWLGGLENFKELHITV